MSDVLDLIDRLRKSLSDQASLEERQEWAESVNRIEALLEQDPRYQSVERNNVARLQSGVAEMIAASRTGREVFLSLATMPLSALEASIRRRSARPRK